MTEELPGRISISVDIGPQADRAQLAGLILDDVLSRLACHQVEVHWVSLDIAGPLPTS